MTLGLAKTVVQVAARSAHASLVFALAFMLRRTKHKSLNQRRESATRQSAVRHARQDVMVDVSALRVEYVFAR